MSFIEFVQPIRRGDDRGLLTVFENIGCLTNGIKRIYYLTDTKEGVGRGFHAHKALEQVAVCVAGSCRMIMDNGLEKREILLDSPGKAIRIPKMVWHEMHDFTKDCVLLVLADDVYDENDYIRNYEEFIMRIEADGKYTSSF